MTWPQYEPISRVHLQLSSTCRRIYINLRACCCTLLVSIMIACGPAEELQHHELFSTFNKFTMK